LSSLGHGGNEAEWRGKRLVDGTYQGRNLKIVYIIQKKESDWTSWHFVREIPAAKRVAGLKTSGTGGGMGKSALKRGFLRPESETQRESKKKKKKEKRHH